MNPLAIQYQEKGIDYVMENKIDSAIASFNKAIEIDPSDISTYENLINIYWNNKQPELAMETLKKVPSDMQELPFVLILNGMTLERMNRFSEAMELYKKAYRKSPKIQYENEENLMEYVGYLILQTVIGKKENAIAGLSQLNLGELSYSETQYVETIEPLIRNYTGGGYQAIFGD